MKESLVFDVRRRQFESPPVIDQLLTTAQRLLEFAGATNEPPYAPPDVIAPHEVNSAVSKLPLARTRDPFEADRTIVLPFLPSESPDTNPWDTVPTSQIDTLIKRNRRVRAALNLQIMQVQKAREQAAIDGQWWSALDDKNCTTQNPFSQRPTEQIVITVPDNNNDTSIQQDTSWQGGTVNVYNFSMPLRRPALRGVVNAIGTYAQATRGDSLRVVPYVLIHDYLTPRFYQRSGRTGVPAGLARRGKPFVEVSGVTTKSEAYVAATLTHEITHQGTEAHTIRNLIMLVDEDGDNQFDYAKLRCSALCVAGHVCSAKIVHSSDYELTNEAENLAAASERGLYGYPLDSLQRDALLHVLHTASKGKPIATDTIPEPWTVERRTGGDITVPTLDRRLLKDPIKLYFADESTQKRLSSK